MPAETKERIVGFVTIILILLAMLAVLSDMGDTQKDILTYIQQYEIAE